MTYRIIDPPRFCAHCDDKMSRKRYPPRKNKPRGSLETMEAFMLRSYCSRGCMLATNGNGGAKKAWGAA